MAQGGFEKGQSGNPNGRPKNQDALAVILRRIGDECPKNGDKRTYNEFLALAMFNEAIKGNVNAAKFIAERAYGKAKEYIDFDEVGEVHLVDFTAKTYPRPDPDAPPEAANE